MFLDRYVNTFSLTPESYNDQDFDYFLFVLGLEDFKTFIITDNNRHLKRFYEFYLIEVSKLLKKLNLDLLSISIILSLLYDDDTEHTSHKIYQILTYGSKT